jgi:hypothetical protein
MEALAGSCEHGNETSDSRNCGQLLSGSKTLLHAVYSETTYFHKNLAQFNIKLKKLNPRF